jgi:hypothetical protein
MFSVPCLLPLALVAFREAGSPQDAKREQPTRRVELCDVGRLDDVISGCQGAERDVSHNHCRIDSSAVPHWQRFDQRATLTIEQPCREAASGVGPRPL